MKIQTFENRDDWMLARRGKITGSRLKDILIKRGTNQKKGYYELIAERIATIPDREYPMDRGQRLEDFAVDRFTKETKKKVDTSLVLWMRDDNDAIAVSPDGFIKKENAGVEVKCLNSASHIEAFLTNQLPKEYEDQTLQYFIVNDKLKKLYFIFYDPRMTVKDFFFFEILRKDQEAKIEEYLTQQRIVLEEVEQIVAQLTF